LISCTQSPTFGGRDTVLQICGEMKSGFSLPRFYDLS
jgi:hypothetical protein